MGQDQTLEKYFDENPEKAGEIGESIVRDQKNKQAEKEIFGRIAQNSYGGQYLPAFWEWNGSKLTKILFFILILVIGIVILSFIL